MAKIILQAGTKKAEIDIPSNLLPKEITPGSDFVLKLVPKEAAKKGEYESLRKLLEELIN